MVSTARIMWCQDGNMIMYGAWLRSWKEMVVVTCLKTLS